MKRTLACLCLAGLAVLPTSGCGTLMFSERQQEPNSGKFDPNILILDGVGLFFFIVPGLVAYGVDFYTGAIYLPDGVEKGEGPFIRDEQKSEESDA